MEKEGRCVAGVLKGMAVDSAKVSWCGGTRGTLTCMKIHERLKSKAVDIHIQKMASLTLNGYHYARLPIHARINSRVHVQQAGYDSQGCRCGVETNVRSSERARRYVGVSEAHHVSPRHCCLACDDRSRFDRAIISSRSIRKGCDSGCNLKKENENRLLWDYRTIQRH